MILLGGFVWAWVAFGQNALMKFLKRYCEAEISSFPEIKEPTLRPFEVWGKVSKIPLGFSEMTKYEWVLMLSKLLFCLMWYLYPFWRFAPLQFFIVLFTKSCLRLHLVQLMSTKFLMSTLVWQKILSGLFKITKYIKYLYIYIYIYLQKQEVITTGYFSVSCNKMIIIEIDSLNSHHIPWFSVVLLWYWLTFKCRSVGNPTVQISERNFVLMYVSL